MATLNPSLPGSAADIGSSLNASRGQDGDRSIGTLFQGAAQGFADVIKSADFQAKNAATEEVRDKAEVTRDAFIDVDGVTAASGPSQRTPDGVAKATTRAMTLREAYEQGKVPESHYWKLMDTIARDVRARYPGYREEIDKEMSRVVGGTPANELVRLNRTEAMGKRSEAEKTHAKAVEEAIQSNPVAMQAAQKAGRDFKGMSIPELQAIRLQGLSEDQLFKRTDRVYKVEDMENKTVEKHAERFTSAAVVTVRQGIDNTIRAATGKTVIELVDEVVKNPSADPKTIDRALGSIGQARAIALKQFEDRLDQSKMKVGDKEISMRQALGSTEKIEQRRQELTSYYDNLAEVVSGKKGVESISQLGRLKVQEEMISKGDNVYILQNSPIIRKMAAIDKVAGQVAVNSVIASSGNDLKNSLSALDKHFLASILSPEQGTIKQQADKMKSNGVAGEPTVNMVNLAYATITDNNSTAWNKKAVVDTLFGREDKDFLFRVTDKKMLTDALNKISTPAFANAMKQIDAKDPGSFFKYEQWVTENALKLDRMVIESAKQITEARKSGTSIDLNMTTGTFEITRKTSGKPNSLPHLQAMNTIANQEENQYKEVLGDLNKLTKALLPVYQAKYGTQAVEKMAERATELYGIDFKTMSPRSNKKADETPLPKESSSFK